MTDVMRLALFVCVLVLVVIPDPCRAFLGPSSLSVNTATANPNPNPNPTPTPNPNPNCCQQCEAHDSQFEEAVEGALESVFESALRLVSQSLEALFNGVLIKLFAAPGPVLCHATGVSELVKSVWLLRAGHMPHWHQASAAEHSRAADASLVVHVQPSSTYQGYMSQYWQHAPPPPTAHTSSPYGAQAAVEYPTVPSSQAQAPSRPTLQHSNGHISNHHTAGLQHSASALQRTMHFNDFTQEELYLVQHMRSYFQSYTFGSAALEWLTDVDFLRFIRARQGNVQKAIEMLRTHLDWRMEQSVDSIFLEGHESSPLNSVAFWTHENANGCPTIVFRASQFTPELATAEQWQRHLIMLLELGRKELQVGTDKQLCVCIDREEAMRELLGDPALKSSWGVWASASAALSIVPAIQILKTVLSCVQDNYPEILSTAVIVPTNSLVRRVWDSVSLLVDVRTTRKICLVQSSSVNEIFSHLSQIFSTHMLPRHLGGHLHSWEVHPRTQPWPSRPIVHQQQPRVEYYSQPHAAHA